MQPASLRILLVEDSPTDAKLVTHELKRGGRVLEIERVETGPAMREALARRPWDVVISDWSLPQFSAGAALEVLKDVGLDILTTFKIYFPRVDSPCGGEVSRKAPTAVRGTETIFLVEDEQQVRDVTRGILHRHGYTVVEASNGAEALALCERHEGTIDLLVSDVVMPGMSGPELAKWLAPSRPEMRVLCMSGYTDDAAVRHGVIDAELVYLQKPITVEGLTRKVREVLDAKPGAR